MISKFGWVGGSGLLFCIDLLKAWLFELDWLPDLHIESYPEACRFSGCFGAPVDRQNQVLGRQ